MNSCTTSKSARMAISDDGRCSSFSASAAFAAAAAARCTFAAACAALATLVVAELAASAVPSLAAASTFPFDGALGCSKGSAA